MSSIRLQIAEELLGCSLEDGIYAPCPGASHHTKGGGRKDFRVVLDGAPTGYCFHTHCGADVDAFNKELRRRIWFAEHGRTATAPRGHWADGIAPEPKADVKSRPELDRQRVADLTRGVPSITADWLLSRSPVAVQPIGGDSGAFLNHLYPPGERILVFTSQTSQGNFLWWTGRGGFRLASTRGVKAKPSALPSGAPEGVWYLVQPVTGQWAINAAAARHSETAKWSRRSEGNVTAWRYYVLESDELDPATWLKVLVSLPLPIAAIYTSGGRSIHALMRFDVDSKPSWDAARNVLRQVACPLGADPAALTAVRLSRLPGCRRGQHLQRLLFLNPEPDHEPLRLLPALR